MSIDEARNRCPAVNTFINRLVELELPLPDDASTESGLLALDWSASGVTFWFEPDAEECGVIDELDAAILKGLDPSEWPYPTAEGYAEYVLTPRT
jgi:hypothetical protein